MIEGLGVVFLNSPLHRETYYVGTGWDSAPDSLKPEEERTFARQHLPEVASLLRDQRCTGRRLERR